MLAATASRLLHTRSPTLVNEMTKFTSVYHGFHNTTGREHHRLNQLGDCYSRQVSLQLLDQIAEDWDEPILGLKQQVEELYQGRLTRTARQALATRLGIKGFVVHADNVGKLIVPRYNTGFKNQNRYLSACMVMVMENRFPTAHLRYLHQTVIQSRIFKKVSFRQLKKI